MSPARVHSPSSPTPSALVVIPARYASTRLPGKPLSLIGGRPMVQWVYERAQKAEGVAAVVIATDDERVLSAVRAFGGRAEMTSPEIASGTDRVAAISRMPAYAGYSILINVQGDEPFIEPRAIELAAAQVASGAYGLATLMTPIRSEEELRNPAVVKVVADRHGRALYFSRHPIPYSRKPLPAPGEPFACRRHVGLYAYSREILHRMSSLPPSPCEQGELLEQLRALEDGIAIGVSELDFESIGVDTPEELEKARARAARLNG